MDRPEQSNTNNKLLSKRLQNLHSFQVYLLRYALFNFPNAKRIIYSTCSLYPEENEEVIDEVLTDIGNAYCLVPAKELLGNNWTNFSSKRYNCADKCLYSKPNIDFCNGFFVAIFDRNFDVALPECKRKGGNINSTIANLDKKKNDMVEKIECKKRSKRENLPFIEKNKEMVKVSDFKKRNLNEKNKTEPPKKKKKKRNEEILKIAEEEKEG